MPSSITARGTLMHGKVVALCVEEKHVLIWIVCQVSLPKVLETKIFVNDNS